MPSRRVRGRGVRTRGIPSPLGQTQASSSSSMSPGGVSSPSSTSIDENTENPVESPELRRRKWASPVWRHYEVFDGKNYEDGISRAFCKYCKGGPVLALSVKLEFYKLFEDYVKMDPSVNVNSQPTRVQEELPGFAAFANDDRRVSSTQLDMYLDETLVYHTLEIDILLWWKENGKRFSIVATMARDILAIPVTTVASESSFSMGSRIITKWRSSLKPETTDALLTTRTWLYGFEVK